MRKLLGVAAATLLLALTGCGGNNDNATSEDKTTSSPTESTASTSEPTEDTEAGGPYCDALKNAKNNLSDIDFTKLDEKGYERLTSEIQKVTDVAPSDVQDDWTVVLGALTDLRRLLAGAGISFDDLAELSAGQVPPGVDAQQLQRIGPKLQKLLAGGKFEQSSRAIQKSAKDLCGLNLD